jgi:hypothetical protein
MGLASKGPASVIASTVGMELSELRDYRYHYGKTKRALFAIGEEYLTIGATRPTPEEVDGLDLSWEEHPDQFWARQASTTLWVGTSA